MAKITFYPLGNADCCLIDFDSNRKMLVDYAHCREGENEEDLRIDLFKALHENLDESEKDFFDVVSFSHADEDHVRGSSEFFYFEHAKEYQNDDRIKIKELWVPAALILEKNLKNDAKVIRSEARYRLKQGEGIRVFSRPKKLEEWLNEEGLSLEDRQHLITDAGNLAPDFTKISDSAEVFIHSPFAFRDGDQLQDRNEGSLVFQVTFFVDNQATKFILGADTTYDAWTDIVNITRNHGRDHRLIWAIFKLPHHCSYTALSNEKGEEKTEPVKEVKWLFEQGENRGIIVSTSNPIPEDDEDDQPPHRQAANYYKECIDQIDGEFKVTMEHPKESKPEPLIILIDSNGATIKKQIGGAVAFVTSRSAPRAGLYYGY